MNATEPKFLTADEVAEILGTSKSYAYKVMQRLNKELAAKGKITVSGKISRKYFMEKLYC